MDPLSITVAVLRITTTCVAAAKELNEIHDAWKRAPVTVSSLCSQLKLISASLSQIQSLLLNDTDVLQAKPALVETFDTTLTSCLVLSACLEKYMLKIGKCFFDDSRLSWKAKFKTLWNENEVKELLDQLCQQHAAISTLVNLLQMDSLTEMMKLIQKHDRMLQRIARDTQHMRKTHSIDVAESILVTGDGASSIFSKLPICTDTSSHSSESCFESEILRSNVYLKARNDTVKQIVDTDDDDEKASTGGATTMYDDDSDCTMHPPSAKQDEIPAPEPTTTIYGDDSDCTMHLLSAKQDEIPASEPTTTMYGDDSDYAMHLPSANQDEIPAPEPTTTMYGDNSDCTMHPPSAKQDEIPASEPTTTMYSDDSDCTMHLPSANQDEIPAPEPTTLGFAPLSDLVQSAWNSLQIQTIGATCIKSYSAERPEELDFENNEKLPYIRKVNAWHYFGYNSEKRAGTIDRRRIYVWYALNVPLQVKTSREAGYEWSEQGWLPHSEEETLEIDTISHDITWYASPGTLPKRNSGEQQNRLSLEGKHMSEGGWIRVDAIELDSDTSKHMDAILSFSACSDLRLVDLSLTKREQRIEEIMRESYPVFPLSVVADCRTFKELQLCARIARKVKNAKRETT